MKSGKIIRIENDLIIIRIISDNSIIEIHRSNFTFVPNVGDSIEIFKNDDETIVTKMDQESETSNMNEHDDGINIDSNGICIQMSQNLTVKKWSINSCIVFSQYSLAVWVCINFIVEKKKLVYYILHFFGQVSLGLFLL